MFITCTHLIELPAQDDNQNGEEEVDEVSSEEETVIIKKNGVNGCIKSDQCLNDEQEEIELSQRPNKRKRI